MLLFRSSESDLATSLFTCEPSFSPSYVASEPRPMTSHARMEGMHAARNLAKSARTTPRRKSNLPQLESNRTGQSSRTNDKRSIIKETEDTDTEAFKQAMWAGQANILVTVRLRPHLSHDRDNANIVKVLDNKVVVVMDAKDVNNNASFEPGGTFPSPQRRHTSLPMRKLRQATHSAHPSRSSREKRYAFDYVFAPEDGQEKVYFHTTKFLIHGILNGFNATVFAYGCTGAGKTYTMLGTKNEPGIMALTLDDLFQQIERTHCDVQSTVQYKVIVSFLEVYNENIRDLLASTSVGTNGNNEFLDLREDPIKGCVVAGISEIEASNAMEVMELLRKGNKRRSQEATAANSVSSRSHAVLQVLVEQHDKNVTLTTGLDKSSDESGEMISIVKVGKLSMVDLAGSERAAVTQNRGQRLIEGANINRSLLALGNCINALGEKGASGSSFVPYRDSKLTRLLKDSLGGNCRTVMIANVSRAASSLEETLNTLKYANRAKNIKTTVTRNVLNVDHHITEYVSIISGLKDEIVTLKKRLARQQDHGDARHDSVPETEWAPHHENRRDKLAGNNNGIDELTASQDIEWKNAKIREARDYIRQCFQERSRLKRMILNVAHQINDCNNNMQNSAKLDLDIQKSGDPQFATKQIEASINDPKQDLTCSDPNAISPVLASGNCHNLTNAENTRIGNSLQLDHRVPLTNDKIHSMVKLLALQKELQRQLAENERGMKSFHAQIMESPLLEQSELLRDILLMEYRVGDLEVEKMEMIIAQDLKNTEIFALKARIGINHVNYSDFQQQDEESGNEKIQILHQLYHPETTKLLQVEASPESHNDDDPQLPDSQAPQSSPRNSDFEVKQQFHDKKDSARNDHDELSMQTSRKHWGIHLNNATLPYIRLKKKLPTPVLVEANSNISLPVLATKSSSTSLSAPYLKVLKHRRKSQQSSKGTNSSKKTSLSQKK